MTVGLVAAFSTSSQVAAEELNPEFACLEVATTIVKERHISTWGDVRYDPNMTETISIGKTLVDPATPQAKEHYSFTITQNEAAGFTYIRKMFVVMKLADNGDCRRLRLIDYGLTEARITHYRPQNRVPVDN